MDVGQLAGAPARPPLDGQHHQVKRVDRLDLQPAGAAAAGLVRRGQRLRHHALMAGSKRHVQEPLGGAGIGGGEPVHPMGRRDDRVQGRQALTGRAVQQVDAVKMQQIEEEGGQRLRGASRRDVDAAILPAPTRPPPEPRCGRMGPSDDDVVDDRLRLRGSHRRLPRQLPLTWRFSAVSPPAASCFVSHRGSNPSVTHSSHHCAQSCRARPRGCGRSCLCPSSMRCTVCAPFKAVAGHHAPRPSWPLLPSITRWQPRAHTARHFRRSAGITEPAASDSRPQMTWWASTIATVLGIDGQLV